VKSLSVVLAFGMLLASSPSHAADRLFGVTTVWYNASVPITARCRIFNAGPKPVRIKSLGIMHYLPTEPPVAVEAPGCTDAPIEPQRSCSFAASLGVYAGGFAMVQGSTKNLRGDCSIFRDDTDTAVMVMPMR
jgi:hypothetical protein